MPIDAALADRVRRVLAARGGADERRMMGGVCFMVAGHMCCGVSGAALMVRVGRDGYAAALREPHVRPLELGGRRPLGYVKVDPPGCTGDAALESWLARGLAAVAALPAREAPPRPR